MNHNEGYHSEFLSPLEKLKQKEERLRFVQNEIQRIQKSYEKLESDRDEQFKEAGQRHLKERLKILEAEEIELSATVSEMTESKHTVLRGIFQTDSGSGELSH